MLLKSGRILFKHKITQEHKTLHLLKKGVYSEETCNVVWILIAANVSSVYIIYVIESVLAAAGINLLEGLVQE